MSKPRQLLFQEQHIANFWAKVDRAAPGGCWIWTAALNEQGYGRFGTWADGRTHVWLAHRYSWELHRGEVETGLHLDHLCRVRSCVNPEHLEPVTPRENVLRSEALPARLARKTHCLEGHPLSGDNLYAHRNERGSLIRHCRECRRRRLAEFRARRANAG